MQMMVEDDSIMKKQQFLILCCLMVCFVTACSSVKPKKQRSSSKTATGVVNKQMPTKGIIQIRHITQSKAEGELALHTLNLIGTPYQWGGNNQKGFDCSGLVQYVYSKALNVSLPRTAREMAAASRSVSRSQLKTGDLLFFNTSGQGVSHVGIYIGDNRFVHSPRSGSFVQIERLDNAYYAKRLVKSGSFFAR